MIIGGYMSKKTTDLHDILKNSNSIEEYHKKAMYDLWYSSLSEFVEMCIKEKGLKKSEIIARANLSKDYGYQIINGTKEHPTRNKVLMLAIGMQLNVDEVQKLLKISGHGELYPRHIRDSIIELCINQGKDVIDTNIELDHYGEDILE